jgi:four helix bundle protein
MSAITTFRDLDAWQVGMDIVELTYRLTADFPDGERYGLVSQMRRASVSVPSNVAEGQAVGITKWGLHHISIAIGSSRELETQLEIALRLGFVAPQAAPDLQVGLDRLQKLLYGLRRDRRRRLGLSVSSWLLFATLVFRLFS